MPADRPAPEELAYVVIPGRRRDERWVTMEREGGITIDRERHIRGVVAV